MNITWITSGSIDQTADGLSSPLASARYRVTIPAKILQNRGHEVTLIGKQQLEGDPERILPQEVEVLIISKSAHTVSEHIAEHARRRGAAVIVDFCDDHFENPVLGPHHKRLATLADQLVVSTPALEDTVKKNTAKGARVIGDPVEGPRRSPRFSPASGSLNLLWFGHPSNLSPLLEIIADLSSIAHGLKINLAILTDLAMNGVREGVATAMSNALTDIEIELRPWSPQGTWQAIDRCDIVLIPSDDSPKNRVKGANRLVEALWGGRCVVAYPLPSYREFGQWAYLDDETVSGIERALDESETVVTRISDGQNYISNHYTDEIIGGKWLALILDASEARNAKSESNAPAAAPSALGTFKRLNLGCGDKFLPGYVNVDVADERLGVKPDVVCDIRKLTAFNDNTVDEILSVHTVEHLWRWEVVEVLKEWVRVLRSGGKMILECPNLKSACEEFLKDPSTASGPGTEGQRSMWVFYGDPRWRDPLMVHRWGYTPDSLGAIMREAGLVNIRQEPAQFKLREPRDMRVVGEKP